MAVKLEVRVGAVAKRLLKLFGPKGERWTKDYNALDKSGYPVGAGSRSAARWCLSGAMDKLKIAPGVRVAFVDKLPNAKYITSFNDSKRTYAHVRRFLEKVVKDTNFGG